MAEKPEKMLEEQCVAAFGGVEDVGADQPVQDQERRGDHDRRHREHDHEGGDQHRPDVERDLVKRHARGALLQNRHDGCDRDR